MVETARPSPTTRYDQDFAAWSDEQGRLLRSRSTGDLDWGNLAEEIETLGRSERSEIRNRMQVILRHLLKWEFQPDGRNASWRATLLEQRDQLNQVLRESPSLRSYPPSVAKKQYQIARLRAAAEMDVPLSHLPADNPYAIGDILDEEFFPGEIS